LAPGGTTRTVLGVNGTVVASTAGSVVGAGDGLDVIWIGVGEVSWVVGVIDEQAPR